MPTPLLNAFKPTPLCWVGRFLFYCFLFPQLPTLFPPGKGPFASLARVSVAHHAFVNLAEKRGSILFPNCL
jgi:hypothetical protein